MAIEEFKPNKIYVWLDENELQPGQKYIYKHDGLRSTDDIYVKTIQSSSNNEWLTLTEAIKSKYIENYLPELEKKNVNLIIKD